MLSFVQTPFLGISITLVSFVFVAFVAKKLKSPLFNPVLFSIMLILTFLYIFNISIEQYDKGGKIISSFLLPVMVAIAYSIYSQKTLLKKYFLAIIAGCFVGSLVSVFSTILLAHLFGLPETLIFTLAPKSATVPIVIELSGNIGGLVPISIAVVILTGIMGATFAPLLIKILKIKDPVAIGIALGTSSHGIGTAKAFELGELQGATSGIAIGIAGFMTVLIILLVKTI